jgi:UDP-N-acetylglucosamine--N-acetylmuramyl-(pentapeptide) pyrophosphoryl-undecaprenol N-acetylglucosamine transferase
MEAQDGKTRQGWGVGRMHFFAGGGTGGHIYPAIAIAQQLNKIDAEAHIKFLCSKRPIDSQILSGAGFDYVQLGAIAPSARPDKFIAFSFHLLASYCKSRRLLKACRGDAVVVGTGGFASVPVVLAAARLKIPVVLVNVDIIPGRANKLLARFARRIFTQFAETAEYFGKYSDRVEHTGCPLREGFGRTDGGGVIEALGFDKNKKTLVVTGASSGARNINNAVCKIMPELSEFAESWQVVHLTGRAEYERVKAAVGYTKIHYRAVGYYEDTAGLYAAADLIVGRAGAVSVAEYAAGGTASVCIPYPYHKDRQQYRNAAKLVDAGAAVIVEDAKDDTDMTAIKLLTELKRLMAADGERSQMTEAAKKCADLNAAQKIACAVGKLNKM